jgi:hypothetical protein
VKARTTITIAAALAGALALALAACSPAAPRTSAPATLAETGLYADASLTTVAADVLPFSPQYPLWTDGASKRRWIRLPEGESIDAADVDAWRFPVGTQLWKEFAFESRVETRYMELLEDGQWLYATYLWSADGSAAVLAPNHGVRGACETPHGTRHDVPSVMDCRACHAASVTPVLGFSALQLSSARDPLAPHATEPEPGSVDLAELVERGLVRGLGAQHVANAPQIAATSPTERAALGYLHGNCGGCHNSRGSLRELGLDLAYSLEHGSLALPTTLDVPAQFRFEAGVTALRIDRADPGASALLRRVGTRNPLQQMPALGTNAIDEEALALLSHWIHDELAVSRSDREPGAP